MLTVETLKQTLGFGDGGVPGEYYYSQGMNRTRFGVSPGWKTQALASDVAAAGLTTLPTLERILWFTQGQMDGNSYMDTDMYVVAVDDTGRIYRSKNGTDPWQLFYHPPQSPHTYLGNGLIFDQKQRLLYAGSRYLGYIEPLNGNQSAGTIAVTNGSTAVVGTGTAFTSDVAGKRIRIGDDFYQISSYTDATHITLSSNYTGATASGLSYTAFVFYFDLFQDFGTDFATFYGASGLRPSALFQDWVLFGNGNHVAVLNTSDDSWNAQGFTFPNFFEVRAISSGRTGVLLGANFNNQGVLALWDAQSDRSIAPWVWLNAKITAIKAYASGWLVFTTRGIHFTNGYTMEDFMPRYLDSAINEPALTANLLPQGVEILGDYVAFWAEGHFNRSKHGIYLLNIASRLMEFAPVPEGATYGVTPGAIFFDSQSRTHISYALDVPARMRLGSLSHAVAPAQAHVIYEAGAGTENEKTAQAVKLNLALETRNVNADTLDFKVSVKLYNFKRLLWNRSQTSAASSVADQLRVDGTAFETPEVGDEVTVLHGVNAGQVRHISSISQPGTVSETWTLNEALPNNTEDDIQLSVMPFQLVSTQTITATTRIRDLFFNVKQRDTGKRFLLKVILEGVDVLTPEIQGAQLVYDDLGALTARGTHG